MRTLRRGKSPGREAPGSAQALHLIVSDIEAARDELVANGVEVSAEVSKVFHCAAG